MAHQQLFSPTPSQQRHQSTPQSGQANTFDVLEWYPAYESCRNFFLDHAQHTYESRSLCAFLNILLPNQWSEPVTHSQRPPPQSPGQDPSRANQHVSLHVFVRRLVVTGFDKEPVLHGLFGEDWRHGIVPIQECERRNYLFAAKSVGWADVKAHYDILPHQTVPFLRAIDDIVPAELEGANASWSDWLCMQDWMLGPSAPARNDDSS